MMYVCVHVSVCACMRVTGGGGDCDVNVVHLVMTHEHGVLKISTINRSR